MPAILRRLLLFFLIVLFVPSLASADVVRRKFSITSAYLVVEILDEDLVHFELSATGSGPPLNQPVYTSPMILKTNYEGPSTFVDSGNTLETDDMRLVINTSNLCVEVRDKKRNNAHLTTICPANLSQTFKGLNIDRGPITQV